MQDGTTIEKSATHNGLVAALRRALRSGLPLQVTNVDRNILSLSGVVARANVPNDLGSLAVALDGLIRWKLATFEALQLKEAASVLFGVTQNGAGRTLMERRSQAAKASGYEAHHFRKKIEPQILGLLATALANDSEEYRKNRAAAPLLLVSGSRPGRLPADVMAWEAVEHEETLMRLWASIYDLRAQLLSIERLSSMEAEASVLAAAGDTALWKTAIMLERVERYRSAYGVRVLHSEWDVGPADALSLAGWIPDLSKVEMSVLLESVRDGAEESFLEAIRSTDQGRRLIAHWRGMLTVAA